MMWAFFSYAYLPSVLFFGEVSAKIFSLFSNWVISFLIIEFEELFIFQITVFLKDMYFADIFF